MEVFPELHEIEIRTISERGPKLAVVHLLVKLEYGVTSSRSNSLDISFEVDLDRGLDAAVADAQVQLQELGEALAEAAKNLSGGAAP